MVELREIGDRKVTVIDQKLGEDMFVATIIIRASTENVANDIERALDDGILIADPRLLPGAGAVELELNRQLKLYEDATQGLDHYAVRKFAEALNVVPRTLAENSGADPTAAMHALHVSHAPSPTMVFDIEEGVPRDSVVAGVFDLYATKLNAFRLAVAAAIFILKVDQIVMSKPSGGPKPKAPGRKDNDD